MRQPCHIRADCCHADWQITLPPARRRLMALTEAAGLAAMMRLPARSPLASSVQSLLAGSFTYACEQYTDGPAASPPPAVVSQQLCRPRLLLPTSMMS